MSLWQSQSGESLPEYVVKQKDIPQQIANQKEVEIVNEAGDAM